MFLFVVYALLIWYAAFRWRRHVAGVVTIVGGMIVMHLFNIVHGDIADSLGYDENIFRGLMYPYMGLVAAVGIYLFCFPKELPRGTLHCRACWYDLSDMEGEFTEHTPCPECGTTRAEARTGKGRRAAKRRRYQEGNRQAPEIPGIVIASAETHSGAQPVTSLAANDANTNADQQHADR
ncbi:MAG: hypothetical protein AAFR96_04415 [Planctomycetota bacterium]